jgi:HK97 gp10 family phage protein
MKVDLNFQSALNFFGKEIKDIAESMYSQRGKIVRDCAKVVKANIIKNLPESDKDSTDKNYDGSPYTHMKVDIKITVIDNAEGDVTAIVHGGKETAYKWHLLDNGTSDTPALHFTDKSMKDSESDFDAIMSSATFKAVDSGR